MINTNLKYCTNPHFTREMYKELETITSKDYHCKEEVLAIEVNHAVILPAKPSKEADLGIGGIVDANGDFVEESVFRFVWSKEKNGFGGYYQYDEADIEEVDETVIYLGPLKNEWGHFLIDFMQRLWYVAKFNPNYKIVYLDVKSLNYRKPMLKNIVEMFQLLGIEQDNIIPVKKLTRFKKVIIPQMYFGPFGYRDGSQVLFDKFIEAANQLCSGETYDKIYFTRCQMKNHKEIGEELIEKFFRQNGYEIIAPEKLSAKEQIYYMSHCKVFASIEGSAAHNIVFANRDMKQIIVGKRCRNNLRQPIINQMAGIDVTYVSAFATFERDDGFIGPFLMDVNKDFIEFAKDHNMELQNHVFSKIGYKVKYLVESTMQIVNNKLYSYKNKLK